MVPASAMISLPSKDSVATLAVAVAEHTSRLGRIERRLGLIDV
jgi:hypothetical protein